MNSIGIPIVMEKCPFTSFPNGMSSKTKGFSWPSHWLLDREVYQLRQIISGSSSEHSSSSSEDPGSVDGAEPRDLCNLYLHN